MVVRQLERIIMEEIQLPQRLHRVCTEQSVFRAQLPAACGPVCGEFSCAGEESGAAGTVSGAGEE